MTPELRSEYNKKWRKDNPELSAFMVRRSALRRIGWTPEAYEEALENQQGKCAICEVLVQNKRMDADHKHITPPVPRGLLCNSCNQLLGMAKESVDILQKAVEYLNRYEGKVADWLPKEIRVPFFKGKKLPEEIKIKISIAKTGNTVVSEETKKKISKTLIGRVFSESHRKRISEVHKGMKHTPESKEKMRLARLATIARKKKEFNAR